MAATYQLYATRFPGDVPFQLQAVTERRLEQERARLAKIVSKLRGEYPDARIECKRVLAAA